MHGARRRHACPPATSPAVVRCAPVATRRRADDRTTRVKVVHARFQPSAPNGTFEAASIGLPRLPALLLLPSPPSCHARLGEQALQSASAQEV